MSNPEALLGLLLDIAVGFAGSVVDPSADGQVGEALDPGPSGLGAILGSSREEHLQSEELDLQLGKELPEPDRVLDLLLVKAWLQLPFSNRKLVPGLSGVHF